MTRRPRRNHSPAFKALGEDGDDLRVQSVGLGEPPQGAGEVADLARVDHRQRQAGARQRSRHGQFEAAGGFQDDQGDVAAAQIGDQPFEAFAVARDGEGLPRGADMHVEANQSERSAVL